MGAAQSLPVVGEVVTVIDSAVKITAAGVCAVGAIFDDDAKDNAIKFARDAGQTWVEYSERNVIAAPIRGGIHALGGDTEEAKRVLGEMGNSLVEVVDSTPVVGHIKGGIHYIVGDTEHGHKCMTGASRSLVVLGAGAVTGGLGGGAVLVGLAGIGGGVAYDGGETAVKGRPSGVLLAMDNAKESAKDRDFHGYLDSVISTGYALTGDFVAGSGGAKGLKRLHKVSVKKGVCVGARKQLSSQECKSAAKGAVDRQLVA